MNKKVNVINTLIIVSLILLLYIISFNIPITADDFAYSLSRIDKSAMNNIFDVIESVIYEYNTWMGRLLCFFFAQASLASKNQILFRITYPAVILFITYMVCVLITGKKRPNYSISILILLFVLTINKAILNQTVFWIIGYYTYVFPLVFMLYPILYVVDVILDRNNSNSRFKNILLVMCSFLSCLFVEHYAIFVTCFILYGIVAYYYKHKKINITLVTMFIVSIVGTYILLAAPGIANRTSPESSIKSLGNRELLYYGYTRFIYTFFELNQNQMAILSLVLLITLSNYKSKVSKAINVLLLSTLLINVVRIFNLVPLISDYEYISSFDYIYYYWDRIKVIKISLTYIYMAFVYFISLLYISYKNSNNLLLILLSAALMLQLIFVATTYACERSALISTFLIIVIILYLINDLFVINTLSRNILFLLLLLVLIGYSKNYVYQYKIYKINNKILNDACINKSKEVSIYEYDYNYVFKSEIDFADQKNWVLQVIRDYYRLDEDVLIYSMNNK